LDIENAICHDNRTIAAEKLFPAAGHLISFEETAIHADYSIAIIGKYKNVIRTGRILAHTG
jgi:hypothetical protein